MRIVILIFCLCIGVLLDLTAAEDVYVSPEGNHEIWEEKPSDYLTPGEWAALHPQQEEETTLSLDSVKTFKKGIIDANTRRIRARDGLLFSEERFDMSDSAMQKWFSLMAAKDALPYPLTILTLDDKPFVLIDQDALMQFASAVLAYETSPDSPLSSGRALRARVDAAETIEEVNAIIDSRE